MSVSQRNQISQRNQPAKLNPPTRRAMQLYSFMRFNRDAFQEVATAKNLVEEQVFTNWSADTVCQQMSRLRRHQIAVANAPKMVFEDLFV